MDNLEKENFLNEVLFKDNAGRRLALSILEQLGYSRDFIIPTNEKCSWDLEYVIGNYRELFEIKVRRYSLHQFNYWLFEDIKHKAINVESYYRQFNAVKQIQIFNDGVNIMDVTKICLCSDRDFFERDTIEDWQKNDSGGGNVPHRGSRYNKNDLGYNEWFFVNPTNYQEMLENKDLKLILDK